MPRWHNLVLREHKLADNLWCVIAIGCVKISFPHGFLSSNLSRGVFYFFIANMFIQCQKIANKDEPENL